MRISVAPIAVAAVALTGAASAMTLQSTPAAGGHRSAAVDPDAHLEGLAAASSRASGNLHGRPAKADRSIIKNDPQLRAAFAWLNNK